MLKLSSSPVYAFQIIGLCLKSQDCKDGYRRIDGCQTVDAANDNSITFTVVPEHREFRYRFCTWILKRLKMYVMSYN